MKFNSLTQRDGNGCLIWCGTKNVRGYGQISIGARGSAKIFLAHRLSYLVHKGDIPRGYYVCHSCDNTSCVNPDHLWLGTPKDNAKDCYNKNRTPFGDRQHLAKLNNDKVANIREIYKKGNIFYKDLSMMFGVSVTTIWQIINNKTWVRVNSL